MCTRSELKQCGAWSIDAIDDDDATDDDNGYFRSMNLL